jgi:hypothetical protein
MSVKIRASLRVTCDVRIKTVLTAIDLDDQLCLQAAEIGDVWTDRDLAAEV